MMRFGVCAATGVAATAAAAGFDFIEMSVGGFLKPREDAAAFAAVRDDVLAAALPCEVVNGFVPGDLKITGPAVDMAALRDYVETTCARAGEARVKTIVFGSGGARQVPEGWARARAWEQLVAFGAMTGAIAARHGVTIAVEPLQVKECNVLTSVGEAARYVREVDHPAIRLLVDSYHWGADNDSFDDIVSASGLFEHIHVATVAHRRVPAFEPCDKLAPFFQALRAARYQGRVSIEARIENAASELPAALALLKRLAGGAES